MRDALSGLETILLPVADGGDGTVAAALSAGFDKIIVDTVGPTGEPVQAPYALEGNRAVVELAAVVGLTMLPGGRLDPMRSSTYGLGLVIADAIRRGARTIVLGLGGSASSDGGAGMVQALGARLLDATVMSCRLKAGRLPTLPPRPCAAARHARRRHDHRCERRRQPAARSVRRGRSVRAAEGRWAAASSGTGAGVTALVCAGLESNRAQ